VTLKGQHGIEVAAETVRRWLHEMDWGWKRAKLVAKDDDPHRIERLARIRFHSERLQAREVLVFADELAIHLLPKVGAALTSTPRPLCQCGRAAGARPVVGVWVLGTRWPKPSAVWRSPCQWPTGRAI
jgi:hypothetical protein